MYCKLSRRSFRFVSEDGLSWKHFRKLFRFPYTPSSLSNRVTLHIASRATVDVWICTATTQCITSVSPVYHPTHAICDTPFMTYINFYMFRHFGAETYRSCITECVCWMLYWFKNLHAMSNTKNQCIISNYILYIKVYYNTFYV